MAVPRIFNRDMKRLAYLDNAISAGYDLPFNALWTASFKIPANDPKVQYCIPFNYVEIFDGDERIDLFRIIGEDLERSDESMKYFTCEHVLATLINDILFQYHQYGGLGIYTEEVLRYILSKQETVRWVLKKCDFQRQFEYNWENTNLLAAMFAVPKCFDVEYMWSWDTTVYPWEISLTIPKVELSNEIRYRKNMTGIKKSIDVTSLTNRIYALGYGEGINQLNISSVNGGKPYVEDAESIRTYGLMATILVDGRYQIAENLKAYAEQCLMAAKDPYVSYTLTAIDLHRLTKDPYSKFMPGNIVRAVDEELGIYLRTRIVRVCKNDFLGDPGSVTVTIANKEKNIAGSIADLQNRAVINETYAQGATNQQVYNFADNCDPDHPATMRLFISDSVVRINKMSVNIEFEAFRAFEKAIAGGGGQTTSSGGGSTTSSGGGQTTSAGGQTTTRSGGGSTTSAGGGQTTSAGGQTTTKSGGGSTTSSGGGQTTSAGGQKTTRSGGGTTTSAGGQRTTKSGGGQTTKSGGGQTSGGTTLESSNVLPNDADVQAIHNHGIEEGKRIAFCDTNLNIVGSAPWTPSGAHTHPEHTHEISAHRHEIDAHTHEIDDHTHKVDAHTHEIDDHTHKVDDHTHEVREHSHEIDDHTHRVDNHTHDVPAHTHEIDDHTHRVDDHTHEVSAHTHEISDHTHDIEFGIWEGPRASSATIVVDGNELPKQESYTDVNIIDYLAKDGAGKITRNAWHTIQIKPNSMSRIVCAVFSQTFCNSRGGGDY